MAVDLIVAHVRGIYDPSVRHESIQLENFDNGHLLSLGSAKKRNKKRQSSKKSIASQQLPLHSGTIVEEIPVVPTCKEALRKSKSSMSEFNSVSRTPVMVVKTDSILANEPEVSVNGLVNGIKSNLNVNGFINCNKIYSSLNGHHSPNNNVLLNEVNCGVVGISGENNISNGGGVGSDVNSPVLPSSATTSPRKFLVASCQ